LSEWGNASRAGYNLRFRRLPAGDKADPRPGNTGVEGKAMLFVTGSLDPPPYRQVG